jgi:hypothetical protein
MIKFLIVVSFFVLSQNTFAQTCVTRTASTEVDEAVPGGNSPWITGNTSSSNNIYSTSASLPNIISSSRLKLTNFNFAIPANTVIEGIIVEVEKSISGNTTVTDKDIMLVKAGVTQTVENKATTALWPQADVTTTYGTSTNLWSNTWTAADINAAGFGVAISAQRTASSGPPITARIDFVRITVCYSLLVPLKIEHLEIFKTPENNAHILLKTSNEINVSNILLQKSMNGIDFFDFKNVKPKGLDVTQTTVYNVFDELIANGKTYYRFKIIDADGRFFYSDIKFVTITNKKNIFADASILNNTLQVIISNAPSVYSLNIFDFTGNKLFSKNIIATERITNLSYPLFLPNNKMVIISIQGTRVNFVKKLFLQ